MIGIRQSKRLNRVLENIANTSAKNTKNDLKVISNKTQKNFIFPKTKFQNPQQISHTNVNINCAILGNQQTSSEDGKFSSIQEETKPIYDACREFEQGSTNFRKKYNSMKNNVSKDNLWNEMKTVRNDFLKNPNDINNQNNLQSTQQYVNLKKGRIQTSPLEKLLAESPLSTKLDPLTGVFRDTKTGLYADLIPLKDKFGKKTFGKKTDGYALCFGSTGSGNMALIQTKVDIDQVLNQEKVPATYEQAVELATALHNALEVSVKASIKKELEDANNLFGGTGTITAEDINKEFNKKFNLTVTGQSMGGGLANYVGTKLGIESACYNPAALGQAAIKDLEKSGCLTVENLNKQKIIRQKGDIVSGEKNQKKIAILANFFSFIKIKRPQHLGRIYTADKADIDATDKPKRGFQSRHFTSSFQPFYDYSNTQATTPSDKSDASSKSSSVNSPSGGL